MCRIAGSTWVLAFGGTLELGGVVLLIRGLSNTRRSFDPQWEGIPTWLDARLRSVTQRLPSVWRRLLRRPQAVEGKAQAVMGLGELEAAGEVRVKKTPPWDTLEPMEAVQRLHAILYEERDRLLDRIRESEQNHNAAVLDEAKLRTEGDEAVRTDVLQLALGGLAQEAWAAALILIGIAVTTATGVCSAV